MDRGPAARKRRVDAPQPSGKPPVRMTREKRQQQQQAVQARSQVGRIREAKDSSEFIRVPKKSDISRPLITEPDPSATPRPFMVGNVEANGAIYLKPRRMPLPPAIPAHQIPRAPATPPRTADGPADTRGPAAEWPLFGGSDVSGTVTPRPALLRAQSDSSPPRASNPPPLSMANSSHHRRRTRSASFSTTADSVRTGIFDSGDFQFLLNGREAQRPKSSVDLSEGLLDFPIPHYRLGNPRFSERGTAYLSSSIYSSMATSEDMRSSVFSRAEYDRMFPVPPGRATDARWPSRGPSTLYLHPSSAASLTPIRITPPPPPMPGTSEVMGPAIYDRIEANVNDPSIVRYSPQTGRIVAATIGRLISQITSPLFLDYELLADFFLAYRNFLSAGDLLDYLIARMKWALGNNNDAGRIVRVRTFVALRHWILNYFQDDFVPDVSLRQRFCEQVNELAHALRRRHDAGGSDINVIGELKKCWRRTCAVLWPIPDGMELSPDVDVFPGESRAPSAFGASATSLPLMVKNSAARLDFRRSSHIELLVHRTNGERYAARPGSADTELFRTRTASIPTSPLSVDSLEVLSCSVPFLRYMKHGKDKESKAAVPRHPPQTLKNRAHHMQTQSHKRSVSFSDALRDDRAPLSSGRPESVDFSALRSHAFTGGLVRGLLLQPSPSTVDLLVPFTSTLGEMEKDARAGAPEHISFPDSIHANVGVKRIVGDMRRVLSSNRRRDSPTSSHRSTNSADSHGSLPLLPSERPAHANAWQQLRGPPRVDLLGERLEQSYKEVFQDSFEATTALAGSTAVATQRTRESDIPIGPLDDLPPPFKFPQEDRRRLNSHLTTGSRSIMIVDDTRPSEVAGSVAALAPMVVDNEMFLRPTLPLTPSKSPEQENIELQGWPLPSQDHRNSEQGMQDLLAVPDSWNAARSSSDEPIDFRAQARKSSNVHPSAIEIAPIRNQLRRRPGGNLKEAENVQDLELAQRPETGGSYSTCTPSFPGSPDNDLSGTHFSGETGYGGLRLPASFLEDLKTSSAKARQRRSSQPDMRPVFARQQSDGQYGGGIEDALAKLEGKVAVGSTRQVQAGAGAGAGAGAEVNKSLEGDVPRLSRQKPKSAPLRQVVAMGETAVEGDLRSPGTDRQGASIYHMSGSDFTDPSMLVAPLATPLRDDPSTTPKPIQTSVFPIHDAAGAPGTVIGDDSAPQPPDSAGLTSQGSFLLDDNQSLSDISTDIAEQSGDDSLGVRSFFFDDTVEDHFTAIPTTYQAPPTPPSTIGPKPSVEPISFSSTRIDTSASRPLKGAQSAPKLLTSRQDWPSHHLKHAASVPPKEGPAHQHLPFVLAYDAELIAEQLTIIEKDALDEVSWRDLISCSWRQKPAPIRNWVDFLHSGGGEGSNGIDIVTTRFNLTVKWIVSEILLTDSPRERAAALTQYIHVAAHTHRLRNYASTYQIVLALRSADLSRLHKTWALVPLLDKRTLDRLELLCAPSRNFHSLRAEMEMTCTSSSPISLATGAGAGAAAGDGVGVEGEVACIPFIGLYTHDLMFNAQKPATIPSPLSMLSPGGGQRAAEPLVNFERFQTAATIVKGLLRLIETSAKYVFRPHPEVLSRCLWLAALEDSEIARRGRGLE